MTVDTATPEAPTTPEWIESIRIDPSLHFCTCARIKKKDGSVTSPEQPNVLQYRLFNAYTFLQINGLPINIIILKPRQSGGSEGTAELCYHHSRRFNMGGFMMADQHDRTSKIWKLFTQKGEPGMDLFSPYWGNTFKANTEQAVIRYKDENGMKCEAVWDRGTANDSAAGASGTRQIIWLSESARYAKDGAFKDSDVIGNALNSIQPDLANTMRIAESTAEGAIGWHKETFERAVYLEDRLNGKVGNGWIRIFVGWHETDDYRLADLPQNAEFFDDENPEWVPFAEDEEAGRIRYGWTREQIAWRRKKIVSDLGGDVKLFRRDYPASPEEAWSSSGSKRFNVVAVAHMLKAAQVSWDATMKGLPNAPRLGSLIEPATGSAQWMPAKEEAWLWCAEEPKLGHRYSIIVDPMTGEQSAGSDKRDNHAVMVKRDGYMDTGGVIHQASIVAAIWQPNGCQWDIDVLGERVAILSRWYGKCIVIPETNVAVDLVSELRKRNAPLYRRPSRPDVLNPSEHQTIVGFKTGPATKRMWVTAAAAAIREGELTCLFLPAVREFDTFVTVSNGNGEAAPGMHDDWVAAYGIAALTKGCSTLYTLPVVRTMPHHHGRPSPMHHGRLGSGAIS